MNIDIHSVSFRFCSFLLFAFLQPMMKAKERTFGKMSVGEILYKVLVLYTIAKKIDHNKLSAAIEKLFNSLQVSHSRYQSFGC